LYLASSSRVNSFNLSSMFHPLVPADNPLSLPIVNLLSNALQ
jgi:hypothetical protein